MGTAYTGRGIAHKYDTLIATAQKTVFLKAPPSNALSDVLNDAAAHFIKRGFDVDRFNNPVDPDNTDAIFVRDLDLFILQASHPVSLEPAELGGRHHVISFYDAFDEGKLQARSTEMTAFVEESNKVLLKMMNAMSDALRIHDDWEQVNIARMMWMEHEQLIESLKKELFGSMNLHKKSTVSHRIAGSLSPGGSRDFLPSITSRMKRRILMKGLSGTGKSTMLKKLGKEAERRGIDVLYGWCGLDPTSVDLLLLPELSVCLFDATQPHEYDPESPLDEILDLVSLCMEDAEAEEKIGEISSMYKEKIMDATGYMHAYAQSENWLREVMDQAIVRKTFEEKTRQLSKWIDL
ncbi:nucleotide kinase [Sporosarcina sp. ACRSL]|uniref:nucleotide kinase n=1 Tax=Sporosarcina sp. ACRSL TaxID=2918215 RepID=UPI001EF51BD0|nr:nucleotide kinase [Sporosarcina sp. ACRSL]